MIPKARTEITVPCESRTVHGGRGRAHNLAAQTARRPVTFRFQSWQSNSSEYLSSPRGTYVGWGVVVDRAHERHRKSRQASQSEP
jgi:hypothetical protein